MPAGRYEEAEPFSTSMRATISQNSRRFRFTVGLPQSRNPMIRHALAVVILIVSVAILPAHAREKDGTKYGEGLLVNVPFAQADVIQAVKEVVQNGIIRGSKEYDRDQYITGAEVATTARGFPEWQEGGTVLYKVRTHALDPRNFKQSGDVGTLAVRYVVQPQGQKNTVLRIDAIFVEDSRHSVHASNGSVEGAEYKDIHDHLESLEALRQEAAAAGAPRSQVNEKFLRKEENTPLLPAQNPTPDGSPAGNTTVQVQAPAALSETPEEHLNKLKRQLERVVKPPGAPLKASPFRSAKTLTSLPSGTQVLIVVTTPYWLGVETHEGQHGWISRDDLELVP